MVVIAPVIVSNGLRESEARSVTIGVEPDTSQIYMEVFCGDKTSTAEVSRILNSKNIQHASIEDDGTMAPYNIKIYGCEPGSEALTVDRFTTVLNVMAGIERWGIDTAWKDEVLKLLPGMVSEVSPGVAGVAGSIEM